MSISPNNQQIKDRFIEYLTSMGVSNVSLKFYSSDLNHFCGWSIFKLRSLGVLAESFEEVVPFLSTKLSREYLNYLSQNNPATKTVNRRLATLRHLARFLISSQIIDLNFMDGIQNLSSQIAGSVDPLIANFQRHLESQKVSKNTIKGYLSDVRHFINWLESRSNQAPLTGNH